MQGNVGDVSALDGDCLADQGLALGRVKFGRNLGQHGVKGRIGVAARVESTLRFRPGGSSVKQHGIGVGHWQACMSDHVEGDVLRVEANVPLGHRLNLRRDLDPDAAQHGNDGQANLFVINIAVVRALQAHRKAVRVTGLGQQLLGGIRVKRQQSGVLAQGCSVERRCDSHACRPGHAAHDRALDAFHVNSLVKGLAYTQVFERIFAFHVRVK